MKNKICYGIVGAGRAAQLHLDALNQYAGGGKVRPEKKTVMARREEQAKAFKEKYDFKNWTLNIDDLLNDDEINIIDICTPPYLHEELIKKALLAGKHVICEKPLAGYFGNENDPLPIGNKVSKEKMYKEVIKNLDELKKTAENSDKKIMYAENFIYAPAIEKAREIIYKKKSRILFMKGEESLKGSSSHVAGEWSKTGGGTFIRTGSHPLSAILWLKKTEGQARNEKIYLKSVLADMAKITPNLSEYEHRHISARPNDVEDFGTVILEFSDSSRAVIMATDTLLGGSRNYVEVYCNDAVIYCKLTLSDLMSTYFLDEDRLDDVYISEMLPSKTGWNNPFVEDEFIRGYTEEMKDFMECVYYNKSPKSDFTLGINTTKIIYLAYLSAEQGKKMNTDIEITE